MQSKLELMTGSTYILFSDESIYKYRASAESTALVIIAHTELSLYLSSSFCYRTRIHRYFLHWLMFNRVVLGAKCAEIL
jgi:hypothetical protein